MTFAHYAMLLSILVPLLGVGFILLFHEKPNLREAATLITAAITFLLVLAVYPLTQSGLESNVRLLEPFSGVVIELSVEPIGMLFALIASFLWIVTSVYSIGYMRGHDEQNQTRFYVFFAIAISSTLGIAFSANLFTLFLFYEVLTLSTYPLVTHKGDEKAKRGGRVYLFTLLTTSICFFLFALIWTWNITGNLDFQAGGVFGADFDPKTVGLLLVLFTFGVGKAALIPIHRWLPAAMVAPTPVSALLHAVAVVKAGVFTLAKIWVYIFGLDVITQLPTHKFLLYIAAFTIIATAIIALRSDNLKRRLAYSTVGQLSYILLGIFMANSLGVISGGMHMLMHAFGKITLFFGAGAILVAAHFTNVSELRGIGRRMPVTMATFLIGSFAIVGMPPTGGMWSKWYLLVSAASAEGMIFVITLLVGSALSAAYLMQIIVYAFFHQDKSQSGITEAPLPILLAMTVSSAGCIVLFFWPDFAFQLLEMVMIR